MDLLSGRGGLRYGTSNHSSGHASEGCFAGWEWDGEQLRAETDRYGMFPLFVWLDQDCCAVSPSLGALVAKLRLSEIDRAAMAVFVHLGFMLGEETPFRRVKVLPPGGRLRFGPSEESREPTFDIQGHIPMGTHVHGSREQLLDQVQEALQAATSRAIAAVADREVWLPLSGGLDSRRLLGEWVAQQGPLQGTFTVEGDFSKTGDAGPAAAMARLLGVPHHLSPPFPRFEGTPLRNVLTHFCSDEHEWYISVANFLVTQSNTRSVAIDGLSGGLLIGNRFQRDHKLGLFLAGRYEELAEHLLGRDRDRVFDQLPDDYLPPDPRAVAGQRLIESFKLFENAANPLSMFYFWSRTRREIGLQPFGILRPFADAVVPFLDHEFFDLVASLPTDVLTEEAPHGQFHAEGIHRAYPSLAAIPKGAKRSPSLGQRVSLGRDVLRLLRQRYQRGIRIPHHPLRLMRTLATMGVSRRQRDKHGYMSPKWLSYFIHLEQLRTRSATEV